MNRLFPMMVLLMSVFQLSQARGELMISFRDAGLVSGGTGSVDVLLRSSQATTLAGFSAKFQISAETTGGVLEFQSTNLQSNSERTFSSLDYSYAFLNKLQDGGFSAERQSNKRQIVASDFATENVAIAANTNYLLARLELQHDAPVATSGNFRISFLDDPGINLFADSLGQRTEHRSNILSEFRNDIDYGCPGAIEFGNCWPCDFRGLVFLGSSQKESFT